MVKQFQESDVNKNNIEADVIILGCSIPGIVTAHKLMKAFGNTMDIVVLDTEGAPKMLSKCNVSFLTDYDEEINEEEEEESTSTIKSDDLARYILTNYTKEFSIPLPNSIFKPCRKGHLNKLFQHPNGKTVECTADFHDFNYLSYAEQFELNQFHVHIDYTVKNMFLHFDGINESEKKCLLYYDQTSMEQYICDSLLFTTSREIMRTTVSLACGMPAHSISVLFYLHQCYRRNGSRNFVSRDNIRIREKLLGYCRKRLVSQLQKSVAEITVPTKPIKEIRTYSNEQVILLTMMGETNYVCNLLAMALRPDELHNIHFEDELLTKRDSIVTDTMKPGKTRKFVIEYENNFWAAQGYSGDIFSVKGPIVWAMEKPNLSVTRSFNRYATLIGYMKIKEDSDNVSHKAAVIDQLIKLFGPEAANTVSYKETEISDVFVPRCGDYVALRKMTGQVSRKHLEWAALDIFAEGDVVSAVQAGHAAYLHLLNCLRPQAQTYEDLSTSSWSTDLSSSPLDLLSYVNYKRSIKFIVYTTALYVGVRLLRSLMKR